MHIIKTQPNYEITDIKMQMLPYLESQPFHTLYRILIHAPEQAAR